MTDCNTCINCQTRLRWDALYTDYLKKNPDGQEFIKGMRAMDKVLTCFKNRPTDQVDQAKAIIFGSLDEKERDLYLARYDEEIVQQAWDDIQGEIYFDEALEEQMEANQ